MVVLCHVVCVCVCVCAVLFWVLYVEWMDPTACGVPLQSPSYCEGAGRRVQCGCVPHEASKCVLCVCMCVSVCVCVCVVCVCVCVCIVDYTTLLARTN